MSIAGDSNLRKTEECENAPWWNALPFHFQSVVVSLGSRPAGFRFSSHIVNIEAQLGRNSILVCGEANSKDLAMTKAIAELVERAAMIEWSNLPKNENSTSSGWAAHETEETAKTNAVCELLERDGVLSQWYSSSPFLQIDLKTLPTEFIAWAETELIQSEYPKLKVLVSTTGVGPSLTVLFLNEFGMGVSGHSSKISLRESIESAISETSRAAHLAVRRSFWADSISLKESLQIKVDPGAHAVFYAYHEPFPLWMFGKTISWDEANHLWSERYSKLNFDDFEFQNVLDAPFVVGFAKHPDVIEVSWGSAISEGVLNLIMTRSYSSSIKSENINCRPHIVA